MRRLNPVELRVMLATIVQWLFLAMVTGALVGVFCSVYPAQERVHAKSAWIVAVLNLPVGQEKLQLSYGLLRWWGRKSGSGR